MRITKFFNLSIQEVEEYLEYYELRKRFGRLGLTGFNTSKNHLHKKPNIYGVYDLRFDISDEKYWIVFYMNPYDRCLILGVDPVSLRVVKIKCSSYLNGDYAIFYRIDRDKRLIDYINETD